MKYAAVYWSRYGNNKRIAETLSEKLALKGSEIKIFSTDEANPEAMPEADLYIFSAPTEAFRIQKNMRTFLKKLTGLEGKKYAIINTHAMKKNWLDSMQKTLSKKKMTKVAGVDFKVVKVSDKEYGLEKDWEIKLNEFIEKL